MPCTVRLRLQFRRQGQALVRRSHRLAVAARMAPCRPGRRSPCASRSPGWPAACRGGPGRPCSLPRLEHLVGPAALAAARPARTGAPARLRRAGARLATIHRTPPLRSARWARLDEALAERLGPPIRPRGTAGSSPRSRGLPAPAGGARRPRRTSARGSSTLRRAQSIARRSMSIRCRRVTAGEASTAWRQHADAAAEVRALAGQRRQGLQQGRRARIEPVPAEHARAGSTGRPTHPRRALGDGRVDPRERRPAAPHGRCGDGAWRLPRPWQPNASNSFLSREPPLSLGAMATSSAPGFSARSDQRQGVAPLDDPRRREDRRFVKRFRGKFLRRLRRQGPEARSAYRPASAGAVRAGAGRRGYE